MRYFLFSAIIHLFVVVFGLFTLRDGLEFQRAGDPTVTFSMVGQSDHTSGRSTDTAAAQPKTAPKPKVQKEKTIKRKAVREEKKIIPEKTVEPNVEKPLEREILQETVTPIEEVTEETTEDPVSESEDIAEDTVSEERTDNSGKEIENTDTETPSLSTSDQPELGKGLVELEDGSIAAKNQGIKGLTYGFTAQPEPDYPDIARKMGFNTEAVIKVRFLIGYNGRVEDVKFYDDISNFGFRNEVEKALNHWRATPITVNGKKVKLYFYKSFKFEKL